MWSFLLCSFRAHCKRRLRLSPHIVMSASACTFKLLSGFTRASPSPPLRYAFPRIRLPARAVEAAAEQGADLWIFWLACVVCTKFPKVQPLLLLTECMMPILLRRQIARRLLLYGDADEHWHRSGSRLRVRAKGWHLPLPHHILTQRKRNREVSAHIMHEHCF